MPTVSLPRNFLSSHPAHRRVLFLLLPLSPVPGLAAHVADPSTRGSDPPPHADAATCPDTPVTRVPEDAPWAFRPYLRGPVVTVVDCHTRSPEAGNQVGNNG